jgi:hypothetical protein
MSLNVFFVDFISEKSGNYLCYESTTVDEILGIISTLSFKDCLNSNIIIRPITSRAPYLCGCGREITNCLSPQNPEIKKKVSLKKVTYKRDIFFDLLICVSLKRHLTLEPKNIYAFHLKFFRVYV